MSAFWHTTATELWNLNSCSPNENLFGFRVYFVRHQRKFCHNCKWLISFVLLCKFCIMHHSFLGLEPGEGLLLLFWLQIFVRDCQCFCAINSCGCSIWIELLINICEDVWQRNEKWKLAGISQLMISNVSWWSLPLYVSLLILDLSEKVKQTIDHANEYWSLERQVEHCWCYIIYSDQVLHFSIYTFCHFLISSVVLGGPLSAVDHIECHRGLSNT